MRTRIIIILTFFIGPVVLPAAAQELHMSQYHNTPLFMNPAATGDFQGQFRVSSHFRDQWNVIGKGFESYLVSADVSYQDPNVNVSKKSITGYGINIYRDRQGEFKIGRFAAGLNVGHHINISASSKFSAGLMLGMGKTSMELAGFKWGNQYDGQQYNGSLPGEPLPFQVKSYFDTGLGLQFTKTSLKSTLSSKNERWIKFCFSAFHLNRPRDNGFADSQSRLPVRYNLFVLSRIGINNTDVSLEPSVAFARQAGAQELIFGTLVAYETKESSRYTEYIKGSEIGAGLHYRVADALVPSIFYNMHNLRMAISYDVTVSSLSKPVKSAGGPEVSLRYIFFRLDK